MRLFLLRLLCLGIPCLAVIAPAQDSGGGTSAFRTLVSNDGKSIRAELVSHSGGKVTIRREDGNQFEVDPAIFCKQDFAAIQEWMKANPAKVNYRLRAGATKKTGSSTDYSTDWYYEVTLRNDGQEAVKGVKILYRVLYESYGDSQMKEGEHFLEQNLEFNRTLVIKSETISLAKRGSGRNSGMKGCLIRVLDPDGEIILDWVSNEVGMKEVTWESTNPKDPCKQGPEVEIR